MPASRPNILLITTDQQRFDTLHAAGNASIRTPHLNWLADNGLRFSRCYSDAPVCIPARTTIMTGRHGFHNGLTTNAGDSLPIDPGRSLPGLLTAAGYQTRAEGKMHFLPNRCHYGFEHMEILDDYYRHMAAHPEWGAPSDHGLGQNEMEPAIATVDEGHSLTHWIAARSIDFLETRDPTRPFFLWSSFSKPHPPFDPCLSYWLMYQHASVPEPVYGDWSRRVEDIPPGLLTSTYTLNGADRFSAELLRDIRRAYYALITQVDYALGLMFARLRELGLLENTWILFTSDHGEMLGDHHLGAKSVFLDGSAHVPLPVCPPAGSDLPRGAVCDGLATLADVYATCLARAGAAVPEDTPHDGLDLLALAGGEAGRERFFGQCGDQLAVIEGDLKYIFCYPGGGELLFDLGRDPYEQHNCLNDPAYGEALARLQRALAAQQAQVSPASVAEGRLIPTPVQPSAALRGRWPGYWVAIGGGAPNPVGWPPTNPMPKRFPAIAPASPAA